MPNRHGPDGGGRWGSVQNGKCGCTSTQRFSTPAHFTKPLYTSVPPPFRNFISLAYKSHAYVPCLCPCLHMTTITHIRTEADLDAALAALTQADPRFAPVIA